MVDLTFPTNLVLSLHASLLFASGINTLRLLNRQLGMEEVFNTDATETKLSMDNPLPYSKEGRGEDTTYIVNWSSGERS